ncbi:hypothetical protein NDN08_005976 [Rhodosorus marinus]|uniref:Rhodanese domain-containing protein n=1 Tax=Rhodosorus marinus TaxID=101924 RepID=A0AAV8UMJ3_9RHOD|nr:hypothetical protein NDN08_005976 [Rhodosorus marinus]
MSAAFVSWGSLHVRRGSKRSTLCGLQTRSLADPEPDVVGRIEPRDVVDGLAKGSVDVVDVREENSREGGWLVGSRKIPFSNLISKAGKGYADDFSTSAKIVFHAGDGQVMAAVAARTLHRSLKARHHKNEAEVFIIEGGFGALVRHFHTRSKLFKELDLDYWISNAP